MRRAHAVLLGFLGLLGCRQDMHDQPRYEPFEHSSFFADGRSARPPVEGTVARGQLQEDPHFYQGKVDGKAAETFPFPITREVLERGRERYGIYCAVCHDEAGTGNGMVVQRGMRRPPSLHIERLRASLPGYYFDVITHGFGAMFDLADRIEARDRWAIAAYVRVLQRSQTAPLADVPPDVLTQLEQTP